MWRVLYGTDVIFDPRDPDLALIDMQGELALSETGEFKFTMPPTHPFAGKIKCLQKDIEIVVEQDFVPVFVGRAMPEEKDLWGFSEFECEGDRGYLNDITLPPYSTTDPEVPSTVDGLFNWYITQYNNKAERKHRVIVGINEGALLDPNNHILRENASRPTVWEEIKEKLLDKLGGFIRMRHENGTRYIDYLADGGKACAQRIEFGTNLLDYMRRIDPTDYCTKVIPVGAVIENEASEETPSGEKVTIESMPDMPLQVGFEKIGEGIVSIEGAAEYGIIEQTIEFDDVATPEYLLQAGLRNIVNRKFGDTLEIDAVDLHQVDPSIESIELGSYVRATSKPHGLDEYFLCARMPFSPGEPGGVTYTLGSTYDTLTGKQSSRIAALNASINKTFEAMAPIDAAAKGAAKDASEAKKSAQDAEKQATEAKEEASSKSRNWTDRPTPPYALSDTWTQGASGEMLTCTVAREKGTAFSADDWVRASKYTDDTAADEAAEIAVDAQDKAEAAEDTANTAKDTADEARETAEETAGYFFQDEEGAHVASTKDDAKTGNNVLITAAAIILRKGIVALLSIKQTVIEFLDGQGYIGLSDKSPLGELAKGLDIYADKSRGINIFAEGTNSVRLIANSSDIKNGAAIVLGKRLARIGIGNGQSSEFGSGGYIDINEAGMWVNGQQTPFTKGIIFGNYQEGTAVWYEVIAGLVVVSLKLYGGTAGAWYSLASMPAGLRPKANTTAGLTGRYHNNVGVFEVETSGIVKYYTMAGGMYVGQLLYTL